MSVKPIIRKRRKFMWKITEKTLVSDDGEGYTGYGVTCGECSVDDITSERPVIARLADELNRYEASPVHILDIVENFLAEM